MDPKKSCLGGSTLVYCRHVSSPQSNNGSCYSWINIFIYFNRYFGDVFNMQKSFNSVRRHSIQTLDSMAKKFPIWSSECMIFYCKFHITVILVVLLWDTLGFFIIPTIPWMNLAGIRWPNMAMFGKLHYCINKYEIWINFH